MTRINCIPVEQLADQHLLAEYREITRVSKLAVGKLDYGKYCLGEGHVTFFYDKGLFLEKRCERLYDEIKLRGYNPSYKIYKRHPVSLNNDWEPSKQDKIVNLVRLSSKVVEKPRFYTLNKVRVKQDYYIQFLSNI